MLADWALSSKEIVKSKKILELGCGVGFTGITIAKLCNVHSVIMTDCHDDVLNTVLKNIEINFTNVKKLAEQENVYKTHETTIGENKKKNNFSSNKNIISLIIMKQKVSNTSTIC